MTRCDCWRDDINKRLITEARIPRRYHHCTLDDFVTYDNETLEDALQPLAQDGRAVSGRRARAVLPRRPRRGQDAPRRRILKQVILTRGARGIFYDTRDSSS